MKYEEIWGIKQIRIKVLRGKPMVESFACYDDEVDISMIFTKRNYGANIRGMSISSRNWNEPDLALELSRDRKFAYLEFFHNQCKVKPDLEFKPTRRISEFQVKFKRINKKFYKNIEAFTSPDYSTVCFKFMEPRKTQYFRPCQNLILETDQNNILCSLWILGIQPDPNYIKTNAWKEKMNIIKPLVRQRFNSQRKVFFGNC
jgi:hypothetical protein